MTPERWRRVERLYHAALEREPDGRLEFLRNECGDDEMLRRDVERLVSGHEQAGRFLSAPAWETAATSDAEGAEALVGRRLSRYQIESVLGRGGTSVVYLAEDTRLGRKIALKLLPARLGENADQVRRFEHEVRAVTALNHPNIVSVYDTGHADAGRFIVMERVVGRTLRALTGEGVPVEATVSVARQIAQALAAAHAAGIIHRDVKPENIMVRTDGYVKVVDFGLARLMRADTAPIGECASPQSGGMLLGTMHYMSPEQIRGETVTSATDVFSFGTTLYELMTGQHPYAADSPFGVLHRILADTPESPTRFNADVPAELARLILLMLDKDPQARPTASHVDAMLREGSTPSLAARPRLSSGGPPSADAEANRYFENAMQFKVNLFDVPRARVMLEHALERDPHFAEARAWHGFTNWLMVDGGYSNDGTLLYEAEEQMRRALQDEPTLARAHAGFAAIYFMQGRKQLMPRHLDLALKVNPFDEDALLFFMHYHQYSGNYAKAEGIAHQVLSRLPLFYPTRMILGDILRQQGELTRSMRELDKILEQDPHNGYAIRYLARTCIDAGDLLQARKTIESARPEDRRGYWTRTILAMVYALEGATDQALREMDDDVLKWAGAVTYQASEVAAVYAAAGDVSRALDWLDRAVRGGDERAAYLSRDPLLATLRDHPRFTQILKSIEYRSRQQRPAAP